MSRRTTLTNDLLTKSLVERDVALLVRPVFDLRTLRSVSAFARLGGLRTYGANEVERFADDQGRRRELLIYLIERAARQIRAWKARGSFGSLYIPLAPQLMEDRTLATSLDIIAKSQNVDQTAFTILISQKSCVEKYREVVNVVWRLRKIGCGVAMMVDVNAPTRFVPLQANPFTALVLGGENVWKRMKTIGPGKLGPTGAWIGWAESLGLERIACDVADADAHDTARLYGFSLGEGSHYADLMPARDFMRRESELDAVARISPKQMQDPAGLPPRPAVRLRRA